VRYPYASAPGHRRRLDGIRRSIVGLTVLVLSACGGSTPAPDTGTESGRNGDGDTDLVRIDPDPARCVHPERGGTHGPDGEGCAAIPGSATLIAGSHTSFTVAITVGPAGIAPGGGVSIGMHHAADWPVQAHDPDGDGHVAVHGGGEGNVTLTRREWAPPGMFAPSRPSFDSDGIFHRVLIARVGERALPPGTVLHVRFGAGDSRVRVLPYVDPEHEFRVATDADGDGRFHAIAASPRIAIVPAEGHELVGFLPSQVAIGDPVTLHLQLEDRHHNRVSASSLSVSVTDEHGTPLADGVPLTEGRGTVEITLQRTGAHRLRLSSDDGAFTGRSNPLRAYEELPERRLWWSDLHGHTSVSDGLGPSADAYFRFARDESRLDIVALTDHGHFDWPANVAAVKAHHAPGEFVTILAQEAGAGPDHMNIYYRRDDSAHLSRWHTKYEALIAWVGRQFNTDRREAIMAPHHHAYDRGASGDPDYPFGAFDEEVVRLVEVYSSHGTSEFPGNPRPLVAPSDDHTKYLQHALASGLRFGVIAASDNHDSHPGRSVWGEYAGGLAGIWASELTRESVWQALNDYRTYGTSLDRIYVEFTIDGQPMGSEVDADGTAFIEAWVITKRDGLTVELLRDNAVIATRQGDAGHLAFTLEDEPGAGTHPYYLRVTDERGERAWSSPIWVTGSGAP